MLLRQVQARPLQGHHLRALRRRGDAAEGAARAHGPHRPGRAGLAHLVLQGRPQPDRLPARHRPARAREGALLRRLDRHDGRRGEARGRRQRPRGEGQRRGRQDRRRPRRGARRARGPARPPPRVLHEGQGAELRRGRRVLGPRPEQLGRGAGPAPARRGAQPRRRPLRRGRAEDLDRGLEEAPRARPPDRDPRGPRPRPARARPGRERGDPDPRRRSPALHKEADKASGSKKGAVTKHINKIQEALLTGEALEGDDAEIAKGVDQKNLDKARELGNGLLRETLEKAEAGRVRRGRPRARGQPLPAHRRPDPEGGLGRADPVGAEGARDVPGHRGPPRRRARGGGGLQAPARRHLAALPRARAEADRQRRAALPRAQGPLRVAVRLRRLLHGRHGRGGDPRAAQGPRPHRPRARSCARRSRPRRVRSSSGRSSG